MASADPLVAEAARHLVGRRRQAVPAAAGGARARSSVTRRRRLVVPAAVVMELTHLATLYHDDVMDEAAVRRGAPERQRPLDATRWRSWSVTTSSPGPPTSPPTWAPRRSACRRAPSPGWCTARSPRRSARAAATRSSTTCTSSPRRPASLIATSARFGGMFGGAAPEHVEALAGYGETIGVAFQLSDDLLDIASRVGPVGQDARHRPARGRADPAGALRAGRRRHRRVRGAAAGDPRRRARSPTTRCTPRRWGCCGSPRRSSGPARPSARYAEEARAQLAPLPDGSPRRAMEALCDFIADRTS